MKNDHSRQQMKHLLFHILILVAHPRISCLRHLIHLIACHSVHVPSVHIQVPLRHLQGNMAAVPVVICMVSRCLGSLRTICCLDPVHCCSTPYPCYSHIHIHGYHHDCTWNRPRILLLHYSLAAPSQTPFEHSLLQLPHWQGNMVVVQETNDYNLVWWNWYRNSPHNIYRAAGQHCSRPIHLGSISIHIHIHDAHQWNRWNWRRILPRKSYFSRPLTPIVETTTIGWTWLSTLKLLRALSRLSIATFPCKGHTKSFFKSFPLSCQFLNGSFCKEPRMFNDGNCFCTLAAVVSLKAFRTPFTMFCIQHVSVLGWILTIHHLITNRQQRSMSIRWKIKPKCYPIHSPPVPVISELDPNPTVNVYFLHHYPSGSQPQQTPCSLPRHSITIITPTSQCQPQLTPEHPYRDWSTSKSRHTQCIEQFPQSADIALFRDGLSSKSARPRSPIQ